MKIILLFVICFLMTPAASSQDSKMMREAQATMERGRKKTAALDAIASMSPQLGALRENAVSMIIEATKTEDPALIPHLKVLASDEKARVIKGSAEFQAHIALAKLGEAFALPEIFAEVDRPNSLTRSGAIAKLAQIGTREAYHKLYVLLDDSSVREERIIVDEIIRPNSELVMQELCELFSDAPKKKNGVVSYDDAAWKAWFDKNRHLIE
jgi:HEAT repeat protein